VKIITDLPFKTDIHAIIIIKNLPVLQCGNCSEYLIEDQIMQKVDDIINRMDRGAEVEILNFAAYNDESISRVFENLVYK
jgi:YgiT-type zinc finger domain-containing protein